MGSGGAGSRLTTTVVVVAVAVVLAGLLFAGSQRGTAASSSHHPHRAQAVAPSAVRASRTVTAAVDIPAAESTPTPPPDGTDAGKDEGTTHTAALAGATSSAPPTRRPPAAAGRGKLLTMSRSTPLLNFDCTSRIPDPPAANSTARPNGTISRFAAARDGGGSSFDWQRPPRSMFGPQIVLTVLTHHPDCGFPCEMFTSGLLAGHEVHVACWGCPRFKGPAGLAEKVRSWLRYLTHAPDDTEVLLIDAADILFNVRIPASDLFAKMRSVLTRLGGSTLFSAEPTFFAPRLAPPVMARVRNYTGWPKRLADPNVTAYLNSGLIYGSAASLKPALTEAAARIVAANRSYDDQTAFLEMYALWRPEGVGSTIQGGGPGSNGMVLDTDGEVFVNLYGDPRKFRDAFPAAPMAHLNGPIKARFGRRKNRRYVTHATALPPMASPLIVDGVRVVYADICPATIVENGDMKAWPAAVPILSDCKAKVC